MTTDPITALRQFEGVLRQLSGDDAPIASVTLSPRSFDALLSDLERRSMSSHLFDPAVSQRPQRFKLAGVTIRRSVSAQT
jgi:hypothetical protein